MLVCTAFSGSMLFPGSRAEGAVNIAGGEYTFDKTQTAEKQLDDLFTTIDIMDATIEGLDKEMAEGHVTSEQICQMYIDRINAYDAKLKLNSVISINPYALEEARKLDKERADGKIRGPLHGIPILIKDNIDLAGNATSGGSLALAHMVVNEDAFVVKKLKDAGAVILAKANLSEFASSAVDSKSLLGGTVHNAYDTSRVPAGSSGGTGVAITSNFATVGLGTDTGGSIRNPSSYSNLYGIRPSKGLTSIHGIIPLVGPRDTVGPMARTAQDMAQVLEVIAGTDSGDDFTQEAGADGLRGSGYMSSLSKDGLKGKRIGYLDSSFDFDPDRFLSEEEQKELEARGVDLSKKVPGERIDAMIKNTRASLTKGGAVFVNLSSQLTDRDILDDGGLMNTNIDNTTEYDFNKYLHEKGGAAPYKTLKALYKSGKAGIDYTNLPVEPGEVNILADSFEATKNPYDTKINGYMRAQTWQRGLEGRNRVMEVMKKNDIDAIMYVATLDVVPTYANLQKQFNANIAAFQGYGFTFGPALGLPETVIPMGFSDTDAKVSTELPLGMRLVGKFGDEKTLMDIAYAYEQQAGESVRKMPANSPALEDKNLEAFLEALIDEASSIDYSRYNAKPEGKVKIMDEACRQAAALNTTDPYVIYDAARKLAQSYDKVMKALIKSGLKKPVKSIKLSGISKKIAPGRKFRLTAKVLPEDAACKKLKWTSSNKTIATVSQNGLVKIKKKTGGKTVRITAASTDGSRIKAVWKIKVMKGSVKKITVKGMKKSLKAGSSLQLTAKTYVTKGRPVNRRLKWTSSNKAWATVSKTGKVKALKAGKGNTVKITVRATDGSKKKKTVSIKIN